MAEPQPSPTCIRPDCEKASLQLNEVESTWTHRKYFCPRCRHIYVVPTKTGKVSQVAPIATAACIVGGFFLNLFVDIDMPDLYD